MKTQVVIVGGGPSGTGLAISLKKQGIKSIIVEKEGFPRLHVGESVGSLLHDNHIQHQRLTTNVQPLLLF